MDTTPIKPGQLTTRAAMHEAFGGGSQGGIITPKDSPNILIYVDHDSGKKYGYEDGWLEEVDDLGLIFEYTGQGTRGDQTFIGRNGSRNAAVLCHAENGKSLRVFMAAGKVADRASSAKQQRYVGEFELDSRLPYTIREAHDEKGERRRIIVFRLRPKGAYERLSQDVITRAEETDTQRVSATVVTSKMVEPTRKRASESRPHSRPASISAPRGVSQGAHSTRALCLRVSSQDRGHNHHPQD
jgi:5-methylcytosine-specific restriction protein A